MCALLFAVSYTTDDLVFAWEDEVPLVVDESIELPQHNLVSTTMGDCTQLYSTGNFTCIQLVFTLKRRLGYYMFHTYIPTCLIVIMSWISFWIKPEAVPARVTLCVTSLLTLSTQHAQSQKSLPPRVVHQGHRHIHVLVHGVRVRLAHGVRPRQHPHGRDGGRRRRSSQEHSGCRHFATNA
ncbi:hypothetical protein MTO96_038273, partial [Rhipicephalus appendiculatus]